MKSFVAVAGSLGLCVALGVLTSQPPRACADGSAFLSVDFGPLKVGSKAPELKVGKWLKGDEVKSFEPGHVYVVEFWATWCPPCRKSIPHLTELQDAHKDANLTIIGVSVWERTDVDAVQSFVDKQGDAMKYTVAADTDEQFMAKNWMTAAGRGGIPAAFVVNHEGVVSWIGHPMTGLDQAVEKALAAAPKKEATPAPVDAENDAPAESDVVKQADPMAVQFQEVMELDAAGRTNEAIAKLDEMIAQEINEPMRPLLLVQKFHLLIKVNQPNAAKLGNDLVNNIVAEAPDQLIEISNKISQTDKAARQLRQLAIDAATKASQLEPENLGHLDALAVAQFHSGAAQKAIDTEKQAIEAMTARGENADQQLLATMNEHLQMFKDSMAPVKTPKPRPAKP